MCVCGWGVDPVVVVDLGHFHIGLPCSRARRAYITCSDGDCGGGSHDDRADGNDAACDGTSPFQKFSADRQLVCLGFFLALCKIPPPPPPPHPKFQSSPFLSPTPLCKSRPSFPSSTRRNYWAGSSCCCSALDVLSWGGGGGGSPESFGRSKP